MSELNYRLNFIPAVGMHSRSVQIRSKSFKRAKEELDIIANFTLFLHETGLMIDHSNTGWIEKLVDGEWEEVDEDEE